MQYVLLGRALLDGKILIPKGGDVSSVAGLRLGLVLVFNHCVWRCRIRLEASTQSLQDPPESLADEILSDCINRVLAASPTALTTATLPNNTFPPQSSPEPARSRAPLGPLGPGLAHRHKQLAATRLLWWKVSQPTPFRSGLTAGQPPTQVQLALVHWSFSPTAAGSSTPSSLVTAPTTKESSGPWGGALEVCLQHAQPTSSVHHFSDSALTLQLLEGRGFSTKLHYMVRACRALRERLPCTTTHHHVCAHVGIPGNEEADHLATLGIEFSQRLGNSPLDLRAIVACEGFHGTSC